MQGFPAERLQINNNLGSSDPIFYIKAENAEIVIKEKLKHYDSDMVEKIKGFILPKKKIKTQNIDEKHQARAAKCLI